MQHAIQVSDILSLVVTFEFDDIVQLTPQGTRPVRRTKVNIYNAQDLQWMAEGIALKAPEDENTPLVGVKLALQRALEDASFLGAIEKEGRARVFSALMQAYYDQLSRKAEQEKKLQRFRDLVSRMQPSAFGPNGRLARTVGGYQD